jgi:hypothetical protein
LIAYQDAIKWLNDNKLIELVLKLASWRQGHFIRAIGDYKGAQEIAGAIFETQLDLSHPINFSRNTMPIFRNTSIIIEPNKTVITTLFNTQKTH